MSRKFLVPVSLPGNPTQPLEATPKQYVDALVGGGGASGFTFSQDAKPTATAVGQTWYETDTGNSYVWTNDGTSSQWVQFAPGSGPYPAASWGSATVPAFNWFISGGAGSSPANPRAMSLASFASGSPGDITLTDANTSMTFNSAGTYQLNFNIQVSGHWVAWVQVRQYRSSTVVNGATAQDSRGTWGNPPGVNGFDTSYVKSFAGSTLLTVLPGDKIQAVIWTTGGADATSVVGDGSGYSRVSVARIAA